MDTLGRLIHHDQEDSTESGGYKVFRKVWFIVILSGLMNAFNALEQNILLPYFYSRVRCCDGLDNLSDGHYDISDTDKVQELRAEARMWNLPLPVKNNSMLGTEFVIAACDLPQFPTQSKLWSMSSVCNSKATVLDRAQELQGVFTPLQKMTTLVVLPIGGALADALGRRPALLVYALCCMVAALCFMFDALSHASLRNWIVYLAGMLLSVAWEPKDTALIGAIADLNGNDEAGKSSSCSLKSLADALAWTFGFLLAFVSAKTKLHNYAFPWLVFAGIGLSTVAFISLLVPETLSCDIRKSVSSAMMNPVKSQLHALQLFKQDKVLTTMAIMTVLWYISISFLSVQYSYLILIGFPMDKAFLPPLIGQLVTTPCLFMLVSMMPVFGVRRGYVLGHTMFCLMFFFYGPYEILFGHSGPYLGEVCKLLGFSTLLPAQITIISQRVGEDNQSKCQALLASVGVVSLMIGAPIYCNILFDASARGWLKALPLLVSMALAATNVGLSTMTFAYIEECQDADESEEDDEDEESKETEAAERRKKNEARKQRVEEEACPPAETLLKRIHDGRFTSSSTTFSSKSPSRYHELCSQA